METNHNQFQEFRSAAFQQEAIYDKSDPDYALNRYLEVLFCASVHIVLQIAMITAVSTLLSLRRSSSIMLLVYLAPIIGRCLCLPSILLPRMHNVASLIVSSQSV